MSDCGESASCLFSVRFGLPSSAASKTHRKASVAFCASGCPPPFADASVFRSIQRCACFLRRLAICARLPMLASRLFRWALSSSRLHRHLSSFCLRCLPLSIPADFGFECSALISLNAGYLRNLKWFWIYGSRALCRLLWPSVFAWLRYSNVKRSRTLALTLSQRGLVVMSASRRPSSLLSAHVLRY